MHEVERSGIGCTDGAALTAGTSKQLVSDEGEWIFYAVAQL